MGRECPSAIMCVAFDSVNLEILLVNLENLGVQGYDHIVIII